MDAIHALTTDPQQLLDALDADALAAHLEQLDRERKAVLILLRAARKQGKHDDRRREGQRDA